MNTANRIERLFNAFAASALTLYALGLLGVTLDRYIA